jgi:hypothetical protein
MADAALLRQISTDSSTDPRTVKKFLNGATVSRLPRERIYYAMHDRGLQSYIPASVAESFAPKSRA